MIKQEAKSPRSLSSRSSSPKDELETNRKDGRQEDKRVLKEINDENGKCNSPKEENLDEENDVDVLKEKLRRLEDNSKCSKCLVRFVALIILKHTKSTVFR